MASAYICRNRLTDSDGLEMVIKIDVKYFCNEIYVKLLGKFNKIFINE